MGLGKRVCEIPAAVGASVPIGVLVWYLSFAMGDRGYEKEGTLMWEEQNTVPEEEAYLASVADPAPRMRGEQELSRNERGL